MGEPDSDGFVDIEDAGFVVPCVGVGSEGHSVVGDSAGLCSWKNPIMEDEPVPPLNQRAREAVDGFLQDSKNQKLPDTQSVSVQKKKGKRWRLTRYFH